MMVQGEGSSSHDQPVAIADEPLSVVIESPRPPPQSQPRVRDCFLSDIMNGGGESGELCGESSDNTKPEHKIQRIPHTLWRKDETKKYYQPHLVSIGPYYRNKKNLKSFEKLKIQFTRVYVKSCKPLSINELYNKVAEVAGEARSCYAEGTTKDIDDTTFTEMMFLDGCFNLQFIRCTVKTEKGQMEMMMSHDIAKVKRDLFLLGNQLPLKVLRALTTATKSTLFAGTKGLYSIPIFIKKIRETRYSNIPRVEPEHYNNHLLQYMWEDQVDYYFTFLPGIGENKTVAVIIISTRVIQPWTLRWWGSDSGLPIGMTYHT